MATREGLHSLEGQGNIFEEGIFNVNPHLAICLSEFMMQMTEP